MKFLFYYARVLIVSNIVTTFKESDDFGGDFHGAEKFDLLSVCKFFASTLMRATQRVSQELKTEKPH